MTKKSLRLHFALSVVATLSSCALPQPPPLPQNNPADPQARSSTRVPHNLLERDDVTLAIEKQLSETEADAKAAETMQHDMKNMSGKQDGEMQGMQHEDMEMEQSGQMMQGGKMQGHEVMQHDAMESEKKAVADEMKKTADEMKKTSTEMKRKSDEIESEPIVYTCPMHPEVRSDKAGKCPICGMTLVKKEQTHEGH